ncbi:uncharacterized protein GGS22DRAFT_150635 [Annulohypoxylon maeteangense]|uniref:uncharacterized protein n=1 Tax=Annulohypoxylon maeteangense TaxID=1927788 RepID=UPI002007A7D3|nr:uncharacterized protein GGS22DRAFT_150635 [Annulohypoxylon maeteangense]KAI0890336.1 hypothetical protein GGS22DRAFT_150635 [Annulohypoxylon maeteangense]
MSVDSLKSLINNIPDWVKRLEELNGQIDQRQQDLALLPENRPRSSAKSVRNRGSTESLKPRDECPPINPADITRSTTPPPLTRPNAQKRDGTGAEVPSSPVSEPRSKVSIQRQEVMATAQRRARATVRKKQKTDSMISNENTVQKYRSRNMIIVYYDSYVQSFFEELVKFVSMQRNAMRKAKMAAKVARIRRMAELEMPDEEDDDDEGNGGGNNDLNPRDSLLAADIKAAPLRAQDESEEPRLRFVSTRQMGLRNMAPGRMNLRMSRLNGGLGSFQDKGDIWEDLDRGLEFVQGMCEHGAHQFLRDGDCTDEVEKIKARLAQTKEMADKEMARVLAEGPDDSSEPTKSRSFRPMTMRRGASTSKSPSKQDSKGPSRQNVVEMEDEGVQDMDGIKPISKSTEQLNGSTS